MYVKLLSHPQFPTHLASMAAAICTDATDYGKALMGALGAGHESVLEHVNFTFQVEGVSRVLLAQLTRHRIASYSVQSQRYVSLESGFGYVVPPSIIALGEEAEKEYHDQMRQMHKWYKQWQKKLEAAGKKGNEDARFVLPGACETKLIFTMNARELRHFFSLRCCSRAQWEIRELATKMLDLCSEVAPKLFDGAGPGCARGKCPEGKLSCGRPWKVGVGE